MAQRLHLLLESNIKEKFWFIRAIKVLHHRLLNYFKNAELVINKHDISDGSLLSPLGPVLSDLHPPPSCIGCVFS